MSDFGNVRQSVVALSSSSNFHLPAPQLNDDVSVPRATAPCHSSLSESFCSILALSLIFFPSAAIVPWVYRLEGSEGEENKGKLLPRI